MNVGQGFSFIDGLVLGALIGAAVAVLTVPKAGEETRNQIRSEGVALKNRGQHLRNERFEQAQQMVKQGQKGASDVHARFGDAMQDKGANVRQAMGSR
jgi:gas vesicle protein